MRVLSFSFNEVPDLKSAGQSNNTTGLLSTTRVSQGRNRLSLTLLPQTRPRRSISSRILSAMPQCNFILITWRAADVWESARFRSIFLASSRFASCSQAESTPA